MAGLKFKTLMALAAALLAAVLHDYAAFQTLRGEFEEISILDNWFKRRGALPPPQNVAIVRIDDESYQRLGISHLEPFPRKILAQAIEKIAASGAAVTALDLALVEKETDASDYALAEALRLKPSVVGQWSLESGADETPITEKKLQKISSDAFFIGGGVEAADLSMPLDNMVVRRFKRFDTPLPGDPPPLAEQAARLKGRLAKLPSSRDFINFYGPAGTMPDIALHRFLSAGYPAAEKLKDKIVFIGFSLSGSALAEAKDSVLTPFGIPSFGVEVHAAAAANLLEQRWIQRLPRFFERVSLAAMVFLSVLAFCLLPYKQSALLLMMLVVLRFYGSFELFKAGFFTPGALAIRYFLPFAFAFGWFWNFVEAQKKQTLLRDCLSRYVSREVAKRLETDEALRKPSIERREIAAMFTDISRYVRFTEMLPDGCTGDLLNKYLPLISKRAIAEQGTVLKSAGDGVLIIWGAPLKADKPCDRALRAALAIRQTLLDGASKGQIPPLKTKIGVSFGAADVGNVGSLDRFDYTAEGDTLNVASRLSSAAGKLGVPLLMSQSAAAQLTGREGLLHLALLRLKGRRTPVDAYTVLSPKPGSEVFEIWGNALKALSARDWEVASELFLQAASLEGRLKKTARIFAAACYRFKKRPPYSLWKGEIALRL